MDLSKRLSIFQSRETLEKVLEMTHQCRLRGQDLRVKIWDNLCLKTSHHSLVITSETLHKRSWWKRIWQDHKAIKTLLIT